MAGYDLSVAMLISLLALAVAGGPFVVSSPNRQVSFELQTGDVLAYRVLFQGQEVVKASRLGLELEGAAPLSGRFTILSQQIVAETGQSWRPAYGERSTIPGRHGALEVTLRELLPPHRTLILQARAYDSGIAFRYRIPAQAGMTSIRVGAEATEFQLPTGTYAWATYRAQSTYDRVAVSAVKAGCERPLTLEFPDGSWGAIAEAAGAAYPRMLLAPLGADALVVSLSGEAHAAGTLTTPWRVLLLGKRAGELLENNHLLLTLSPPGPPMPWIKPGKVLREVTLSTKGAKEAIDFAKKRNLQYIEFDAGWYGHEYNDESDATKVQVDPLRLSKEPGYQGLDMKEVVQYGRDKGIGVMLYVNRRALERQLPELLPLYASWGIKGVKYGFVNVGTQSWTEWLYDAVGQAAKHQLFVDVHDEFRPTGMSRRWPNLLTQEGILGNEAMPDAKHNTVLPFTRFIAGAADYTVCWHDKRLKTTHAHQLALPVVYYSPLQFLYWYDRPTQFSDEPELEFFDRVPTVWDETRVLDGRPGEFAVIARKRGEDWFVGAITNDNARRVKVSLWFLTEGKRYKAKVFRDGSGPRSVEIQSLDLEKGGSVDLALANNGGAAIWLTPAR